MNRRHFLAASATLAASPLMARIPFQSEYKPRLGFSTLGCPDWTLDQSIEFAAANGYQGIELRGIQRELDLTKRPEFFSKKEINEVRAKMRAKKLRFTNLGSSATLHFPKGDIRDKNIDEGKRFILLAEQLGCPNIRVFPNNFLKEQTKEQTLQLIADGLNELGEFGMEHGVFVLIETHGDLVYLKDLEWLMKQAKHPNIGLVWDCCNMWTITKEPPMQVYQSLKKYIFHTHIKDALLVNGQPKYVYLGKGQVPIFETIDLLVKDQFNGSFSFEWEKMWHPELDGPELAFADYPKAFMAHLNK
ncbi:MULTISPECIES: sugar phosphate isomerase/epimerase family protein [unclassified Paraflavitalea]|uniref:sugar phosphate isomerase/epimerase family protein n=1 Tax=unclassified Paraflavitalea TaxID=2798305 RepID=UPI003D326543